MKGAEGPGREVPGGCGGRELAPDRRSLGGDRVSPWGVPCAAGPRVRSRPPPSGLAPRHPMSFCPRPAPQIFGFLQSAFEAAAHRARGLAILHLGRGRGGAGWGRVWSRPGLRHCGPDAAARESAQRSPSAQRGSPAGGGRTKPYCGLGTASTEWLLFPHQLPGRHG